jgi:hypothetical protein
MLLWFMRSSKVSASDLCSLLYENQKDGAIYSRRSPCTKKAFGREHVLKAARLHLNVVWTSLRSNLMGSESMNFLNRMALSHASLGLERLPMLRNHCGSRPMCGWDSVGSKRSHLKAQNHLRALV